MGISNLDFVLHFVSRLVITYSKDCKLFTQKSECNVTIAFKKPIMSGVQSFMILF